MKYNYSTLNIHVGIELTHRRKNSWLDELNPSCRPAGRVAYESVRVGGKKSFPETKVNSLALFVIRLYVSCRLRRSNNFDE